LAHDRSAIRTDDGFADSSRQRLGHSRIGDVPASCLTGCLRGQPRRRNTVRGQRSCPTRS